MKCSFNQPSIFFLSGQGDLVRKNGTDAVSLRVEYVNNDTIEDKEKESVMLIKECMNKLKDYEQLSGWHQEKSGRVVVQRHRGCVGDVDVSVHHDVHFKSYSTVTAPSTLLQKGKFQIFSWFFRVEEM